ncbi:TonB-dependent receptor [Aquirufa sp. ROCK-SH2]
MQKRFITHSVLLGAFFALLMALPLGQVFAQGSTTAALAGTVLDEKGEGLPGATVIAVHEPTGSRYGASTRADGRYNIVNMRVGGPYKVTVTFIGYKEAVQTGVVLTLAQELRQNFKLEVNQSQLEEVKVVASRSSIINSGRTGAATTVGNNQITTLPTLNRSLGDFARLDPRANGLSFAGRNSLYNNVTVDGAYFNNAFALSSTIGGQANASPISVDAIDQFQVLVAPYDVRQGMATGANINVVTKSGTNDWTGSGYYFGTDQGLVGNKIGEVTNQYGNFARGQFGGRIGGAIIKNKLFVFGSFEQEKQTQPGSTWVATRPGSTAANQSIATAADLDRLKEFLKTKYNYDPGAYENWDKENYSQKVNLRLDWNISDKHKLNVKYNYLRSYSDQNPSGSGSLSNQGRAATSQILPFQGSIYRINNNLDSYIAELNSTFSSSVANNLTVGYTQMRDYRESPVNNTPFPTVDIGNNNKNELTTFGYEPFSANNLLNSDIFQISDNLTIYKGKNVYTVGVAYENNAFKNGFAPNYYGGYQFNSIDDFINSASTGSVKGIYQYQIQYANYAEFPFAEMKGSTTSGYIQDEISAAKGLKLTFGLRADMTSFPSFDDPKYNNTYVPSLTFRDGVKLQTNKFPDPTVLWSPRFGFNWDVKDDKQTQIRGGVGVFSGRVPYVWLSNQLSNNGVLFSSESTANPTNRPFDPDVNKYRPPVPSTILPTSYNLAVTDPNFKFSQVFRSNLALDKNLGNGWIIGLEAIYTKDINAVYLENVNLPNSTVKAVGADNRTIYWTAVNGIPTNTAYNRIYGNNIKGVNVPADGKNTAASPNISDAILIKNTDLGYSYALTATVSKAFDNGLFASLSYTNSDSRSVNDGGSIAQSQWRDRYVVGDPNANVMSYSSYMQAHRINAYGSYRLNYLNEKASTTFGFTYSVAPAGRFSYIYSGDMNGDSQSNDLIYIPRGQSEIMFKDLVVGSTTYSAAQQWLDLDKFISNDPYLSGRRGQYAERNGAELPWQASFDFKVIQDFYINVGGKKNTLQFTLDVFNFGNYVSPQWGLGQSAIRTGLLTFTGNDAATGKPVFQFPYRSGTTPLTESFQRNFGLGSRWQAQFGIRYIFN